jgi:hypothetical protein
MFVPRRWIARVQMAQMADGSGLLTISAARCTNATVDYRPAAQVPSGAARRRTGTPARARPRAGLFLVGGYRLQGRQLWSSPTRPAPARQRRACRLRPGRASAGDDPEKAPERRPWQARGHARDTALRDGVQIGDLPCADLRSLFVAFMSHGATWSRWKTLGLKGNSCDTCNMVGTVPSTQKHA